MADGQAAGGAAESAVRHQSDLSAQALAQHSSHKGFHVGHSGAALGAFVADDDHVTGHDLVFQDGMPGVILGIVALGRAAEFPGGGVHGAELDDGAVGADVAVQHGQTALLMDGIADRMDHVGVLVAGAGGFLAQGAEHALGLGVHLAGCGQLLDDGAQAAGGLKVLHGVGGVVGVDGAQHRYFAADGVERFGRDVEMCLTGQCRDVQHAVGAAAGGHHVAHHVLKAGLAQDVPGTDLLPPGVHYLTGCLAGQLMPLGRLAAAAGVVVGGKAQHLGHGAHGVGGAHKGAGAGGGAGVAHHVLVFFPGDAALHIGGIGLLGVGQGDHPPVGTVAGCHIAAGEHDGGNVYPHRAHQHAGHHLVAGGHDDHAFQHVQFRHGLHLAGNQVTGGQGVAVAGGVAADAVTDAGDGQFQRQTAFFIDFLLHLGDECLVKGKMAGVHLVPGVDQADDGALGVLFRNAHGVEQCVAVVQGFFVPLTNHRVPHFLWYVRCRVYFCIRWMAKPPISCRA